MRSPCSSKPETNPMWDEWAAIEAAQRQAEQEDAERMAERQKPKSQRAPRRAEKPAVPALVQDEYIPPPEPVWGQSAAPPDDPESAFDADELRGLFDRLIRAALKR